MAVIVLCVSRIITKIILLHILFENADACPSLACLSWGRGSGLVPMVTSGN